ncbi:aspartate/glutamate racemase family protein [Yoonia sp. BS5-3]|uniref:Aspartate/glutamate racemase family protein n=1 Tax=Yoonia phaeophyticola TaxID=3137369 RepID=A0ABZ2UZ15_9RHOB
MPVIIINPNSTAAMTEAMLQAARDAAPDIAFEGWTSHHGPAAIQGAADGARAAPPLLELIKEAGAQRADGIIIGCFDDTALTAAARLSNCPVLGIGQAAYHFAALRNWRFSVVTTLPISVPVLEGNIVRLGLDPFLGRVRASDIPVLALHADPEQSIARITNEAQTAAAEDGIDAIVLGCAGMVHVTEAVRSNLQIPVIDPVVAAAKAMRWLI